MKTIVFYILVFILQTSCSNKKECNNRYKMISCNLDSIPILNLDLSKHIDSIRNEMNQLYGLDLCQKCDYADFRLPFTIEGQKGFIKVMVDYDYHICENCPIPMRLKHEFSILIKQNNQLLVEGEWVKLDTFQKRIEHYMASVGVDSIGPENFSQVNFRITWEQNTNNELLKSVLNSLYHSHLTFINKTLKQNNVDFFKLKQDKLDELKVKFPLRIELDLGKFRRIKPPIIEKMSEN